MLEISKYRPRYQIGYEMNHTFRRSTHDPLSTKMCCSYGVTIDSHAVVAAKHLERLFLEFAEVFISIQRCCTEALFVEVGADDGLADGDSIG